MEKFLTGTVSERREITSDLWVIRVRPETPFVFKAGQYATLGLPNRIGNPTERAYSIVSSPYENELELFIERVPNGELTPRLYELGVGDELLIRKSAKGRFTLELSPERPHHLMVATVTGIAPFCSMVRSLAIEEAANGLSPYGVHLSVLHGASRSDELGYRDEMEEMARRATWLDYSATVSRPWEDSPWSGERGRCEDILRKYLDVQGMTPDNAIVYLCGNPQMIENCRGILKRRGFEPEFIREEKYWVA